MNQGGHRSQQGPAQEAHVQTKQLPFAALSLLAAEGNGLQNTDVRIFIEMEESEPIPVNGHNAGDDKQHGPEHNQQTDKQIQGDQPSSKRKAIEEGQVLAALSPADRHAVEHEACAQHNGNQPAENPDKDGEYAVAAAQENDEIQNQKQACIEGGHGPGGDLSAAESAAQVPFEFRQAVKL